MIDKKGSSEQNTPRRRPSWDENYAQKIVDTIREGLLVLEPDLTVEYANDSFYAMFQVDEEQTVGSLLYNLGNRQWDIPELHTLLEEILPAEKVFNDYRVEHDFEDVGPRVMLLNARHLDHVDRILLAIEDITERERAQQRLREADQSTVDILESIADPFYAVDEQWRLTYVNRETEELWGRSQQQLLGTVLWELFPAPEQTEGYRAHLQAMETREPVHFETFSPNLNFWADVRIYPTTSGGLVVYFRDITARKRAEEALRERERQLADLNQTLESRVQRRTEELERSNRRLALALQASQAGIYDHKVPLDENTYHDGRWAEIMGYRQDELPPGPVFLEWLYARIHPDDVERLQDVYEAFVEGRRHDYDVQVRLRHKSGEWRWVRGLSEAAARDETGRVTHVVGVMVDITDRVEAEQAKEELTRRLVLAEHAERDRIARILHDDLQQLLYALQLQVDFLHAAAADEEATVEQVAEIEKTLKTATSLNRRLIVDLSPPVLEGEGLVEALGWLRNQMSERYGVAVRLEADGPFLMRDMGTRVLILQVVRELLLNAVKHAGVNSVNVRLWHQNGMVCIDVVDEGVGFEPEDVWGDGAPAGDWGLQHARERIRLIGGKLEAESAPGKGTRITVVIPNPETET